MHASLICAVIILLFALGVMPAQSQTVDEKACIFAAVQKLPNIPGLSVTASRTKPGDARAVVARTLVESFGNPIIALQWFNRNFEYLTLEPLLRNEMESGGQTKGMEFLAKKLEQNIVGQLSVEIDVRAAGQNATFTFVCAWGSSGRPVAVGGMSR